MSCVCVSISSGAAVAAAQMFVEIATAAILYYLYISTC